MKYSIMFKNGNALAFESDTDIDMDQVFASAFQINKEGELIAEYIKPLKITETDGSIIVVNTNEVLFLEKCWEGVTAWMPAPEQYDPEGGSTK